MALTNWNDILNKPAAIEQAASLAGDVQELELSVADLSASVLTVEDNISELNNKIIKKESTTVTTNSNGFVDIGGAAKTILKAERSDTSNYICLVGREGGSSTSIKVVNYDLTVAANTEVTLTYWYIPRIVTQAAQTKKTTKKK